MFIGFNWTILKKNFIIFFTLSAPKPIQSSIRNVCVSEVLCPVPYNYKVVKETLEDRVTIHTCQEVQWAWVCRKYFFLVNLWKRGSNASLLLEKLFKKYIYFKSEHSQSWTHTNNVVHGFLNCHDTLSAWFGCNMKVSVQKQRKKLICC